MKARFFRSDAMVERLGETPEVIVESEWFQLTYDELRSAPDGEHVAFFDGKPEAWFIRRDGPEADLAFSDVVIYTE